MRQEAEAAAAAKEEEAESLRAALRALDAEVAARAGETDDERTLRTAAGQAEVEVGTARPRVMASRF